MNAGTYVWYLSYFDGDRNKQVVLKGTTILIPPVLFNFVVIKDLGGSIPFVEFVTTEEDSEDLNRKGLEAAIMETPDINNWSSKYRKFIYNTFHNYQLLIFLFSFLS